MKKMVALILALTILCSVFPMAASASSLTNEEIWNLIINSQNGNTEPTPPSSEGQEGEKKEEKKEETKKEIVPVYYHDPNNHSYDGYGFNTAYHWLLCACGCKISVEPHVDPKDAKDDYCICGYHFSDDADLVVLWIDGCPGIKKFDKDTTEYKLNAHTYKDVKEIRIVTKTNDSEATVELPEDLTLKSGENKFEIKVTSENQKVTKIYTVTVVK